MFVSYCCFTALLFRCLSTTTPHTKNCYIQCHYSRGGCEVAHGGHALASRSRHTSRPVGGHASMQILSRSCNPPDPLANASCTLTSIREASGLIKHARDQQGASVHTLTGLPPGTHSSHHPTIWPDNVRSTPPAPKKAPRRYQQKGYLAPPPARLPHGT